MEKNILLAPLSLGKSSILKFENLLFTYLDVTRFAKVRKQSFIIVFRDKNSDLYHCAEGYDTNRNILFSEIDLETKNILFKEYFSEYDAQSALRELQKRKFNIEL